MRFRHLVFGGLLAFGWIIGSPHAMRAYGQTGPARAEKLLTGSSIGVAWLNLETSDVKALVELFKLAGLPTDDLQWKSILEFRTKLRESQANQCVV